MQHLGSFSPGMLAKLVPFLSLQGVTVQDEGVTLLGENIQARVENSLRASAALERLHCIVTYGTSLAARIR